MLDNFLLIKERSRDLDLIRNLAKECDKQLRRAGKDFSWLAYAKKGQQSYKIDKNIENEKLELLRQVSKKTKKKYPNYSIPFISELLSYMVNTKLSNVTSAYGFTDKINYPDKLLIEAANAKYFIPRLPWLVFHRKKREVSEMKNVCTGKIVKLHVKKKENFTIFEFVGKLTLPASKP